MELEFLTMIKFKRSLRGCDWLNVSRPLSLRDDLRGKVVVLDFWTYCCINCMHILPDLHEIERRFPVQDGVVVVGVHSGKFSNERVSESVRHACHRYNIAHPVINDTRTQLWDQMQVSCWPTLLVLGPEGQLLFSLTGEGHLETLTLLLNVTLAVYRDQGSIRHHHLPLEHGHEERGSTDRADCKLQETLSYPGKVYACMIGEETRDEPHLIISDSGHNRIIVSRHGFVEVIIGSGVRGSADGRFSVCQFNNPQGTVYSASDNSIYVADTDNHVIRKADLSTHTVSTVCGVAGEQGSDRTGGHTGTDQLISSPWDLCLLPDTNTFLIAMAGSHQIWAYILGDKENFYFPDKAAGVCFNIAGSGAEENKNSTYPYKAGFAQPSGLCCKWDQSESEVSEPTPCVVYVADSESSSIRQLTLPKVTVKPVCGGDINPQNLFAYGDVDGFGVDAKLQHPLDVTCDPGDDKLLYITDSYNHKIKMCHREERVTSKGLKKETFHCSTYVGAGVAGGRLAQELDKVEFHEPGGIDYFKGKLYVADTNNHQVKVIDTFHQQIQVVDLKWPEIGVEPVVKRCLNMCSLDVPVSSKVTPITLTLDASGEFKLSREPVSYWHVISEDGNLSDVIEITPLHGAITELPTDISVAFLQRSDNDSSEKKGCLVEFIMYVCDGVTGTCHLKSSQVNLSLIPGEESETIKKSISLA